MQPLQGPHSRIYIKTPLKNPVRSCCCCLFLPSPHAGSVHDARVNASSGLGRVPQTVSHVPQKTAGGLQGSTENIFFLLWELSDFRYLQKSLGEDELHY